MCLKEMMMEQLSSRVTPQLWQPWLGSSWAVAAAAAAAASSSMSTCKARSLHQQLQYQYQQQRCYGPWYNSSSSLGEERPKSGTSLHRKPSSAWRKERRRDPIQSEALDMSAARTHHNNTNSSNSNASSHHHHTRPSVIVPTTAAPQPGLQTENSAEFLTGTTTEDTAVTPTASLTASAATRGLHQYQQQTRTGIRTAGVQASDPAIDEHFKRSLGLKDYAAVFNAANNDKETGLSVDDHFAKALGETWTRLQATSRSKDST